MIENCAIWLQCHKIPQLKAVVFAMFSQKLQSQCNVTVFFVSLYYKCFRRIAILIINTNHERKFKHFSTRFY